MFWLLACSIDPAPADVDGLAHWSWVNYDLVTADDMAEAADTLARLPEGWRCTLILILKLLPPHNLLKP